MLRSGVSKHANAAFLLGAREGISLTRLQS